MPREPRTSDNGTDAAPGRQDPLQPATPFPDAPVMPWPVGTPSPTLPHGKAGISVRIRSRTLDPSAYKGRRAVGVDDRPMWHGIGRMIVVTEPGEHLLEVQGPTSAETARLVRVDAGELAELEYWLPATYGDTDGLLVPAPARRRMGSGGWGILAGLLLIAGIPLLGQATLDDPGPAVMTFITALLIMTPVATTMLWSRMKRRIDRRYRAAASYEAQADPRAADQGMFLADGTAPPGLADANHGLLVVTGTAAREYVWNGMRIRAAAQPARDPNGWLPWPSLTIDGTEHPFSWRTWCYRLPPGRHDLLVTPKPPTSENPGHHHAEPAKLPIEITAGQITHLNLQVKATIEVRSIAPSPSAPTALTGFKATITATTHNPG